MIDELVSEAAKAEVARVHTSIPGWIIAYDSATQTADVQPGVLGMRKTEEGEIETYRLPQVTAAPVAWSGTLSGYRITWPLERGDECVLMVMERSIEQWRRTGERNSEPIDYRRFDLSDAVVVPIPTSRHAQTNQVRSDGMVLAVPGGHNLYLVDRDAAQSIVRGDAFRALFNAHTHMTGVGLSGPPQEDALLVPMDNPVSTTGPHTTNRVRVP